MLLIDNIGTLATMLPTAASELGLISDAAILTDKQKIFWCGKQSEIPTVATCHRIDAQGNLVVPGLIDCHTHLIFAGQRSDEFARRMNKESYEEIMKKGGGIMSTVNATRNAHDDLLFELGYRRAEKFLNAGVTTLEAKSGYGLSLDEELRALRLLKELHDSHALDVHRTVLCHIIPPQFANDRKTYVSMLENDLLPRVSEEGLAEDCDVFCERGAFLVEESHRILTRAHALSLGLRAHLQQLGHSDSMSLVTALPIKSVSHADFVSAEDIEILAKANTVVEALPFAALFLRATQLPPIEALKNAKVTLAIATDFNPGSAMCDDLVQAARLGVTFFKFGIEDALRAITCNAAKSLGRSDIGCIKPDNLADIVLTNCKSINEFFYDWTKHPKKTVIKRGKIIKEITSQ